MALIHPGGPEVRVRSDRTDRHRPASHPVLRRLAREEDHHLEQSLSMDEVRRATDSGGRLEGVSADERARITDQIEALAHDLIRIPVVPLSRQQARLMAAIAVEITRRVTHLEPAGASQKEQI